LRLFFDRDANQEPVESRSPGITPPTHTLSSTATNANR
jgi:hypothetical protein